MSFRLAKHHGLGNDFLILFTDDVVDATEWPARARAWCDRHRGIGADGLIVGSPATGDAGLTMTLFNADGSVAEISGNGLRCLAQAEARRRGATDVALSIATAAGVRHCTVAPGPDRSDSWVEVTMGTARSGPEPDRPVATAGDPRALGLDATKQRTVDIGNPHLVLLVEDPAAVDIVAAGPLHEAAFDGGMNVHAMAPAAGEVDALTVVHWERGVGVTEACGSGAAAVAVAAHDWGLVGDRVAVHMPGGDAVVRIDGDGVVLGGPAVFIADIEVDR